MENPIGTTIEQIKLQEQDNESKLKEKREVDATIVSLNRAIREASAHSEKAKQEQKELMQKTDQMSAELETQKLHKAALSQQLEASAKELNELRVKSDKGMMEVWALRSSLGQTVQEVSNECDVWALLMKPMSVESVPRPAKAPEDTLPVLENEDRLKKALERRETAIREKKRLMTEPDTGEEFVRQPWMDRTQGNR